VTPEYAALLSAVDRFANLRRITSTQQVEGPFRRLPIAGPKFRVLQAHEWGNYQRDQDEVKGWLRTIAEGRGQDVARAISGRLGTLDAVMRLDAARQEIQTLAFVQGVQAAYALGVALLLSPSTGLRGRLGHCTAPGCGRFRLDLDVRPGRRWRYCSTPHRRRADRATATERKRRSRNT